MVEPPASDATPPERVPSPAEILTLPLMPDDASPLDITMPPDDVASDVPLAILTSPLSGSALPVDIVVEPDGDSTPAPLDS
eukprot:scaffold7082_cov234-Pinguiococcus_pyrenoidosus.AAC.2